VIMDVCSRIYEFYIFLVFSICGTCFSVLLGCCGVQVYTLYSNATFVY
jgi:hypothetical protein